MSRTCSQHGRRMVQDEVLEEARMVGNLSVEWEERGVCVRFVCPEPGCRESQVVTR